VATIRELIRQNVTRIKPYSPGKISDEVKRELGLEKVVKLASNENPLPPAPAAVEAMSEALADVRTYPDPVCFELTRDLAEHLDVAQEQVIVGRGSDEVIHMLGLAFLKPGDQVIMADPPFALYPYTSTIMDCEGVPVPLTDHKHDLPAMAAAVTEKTRLIFVANPHNPTGTAVSVDEADLFMESIPEDVIVAWDEAYFEYVTMADYPNTLRYIEQGRKVLSLRTFSKIYSLAGLRVGYGIGAPEMIDALKLVREPFNVSSIAQLAARASLKDPSQVERSRQVNEEGKEFLYGQFDELGLEYVPTQANFIFVDTGMDSVELFDRLMRRGVTVRTGEIWGTDTFIRVTIGTREENEQFVGALREALAV
jgi:histidinol-phosphate aminotransferase